MRDHRRANPGDNVHGLSPYQSGIWAAVALDNDSAQYNLLLRVRFEGELDLPLLAKVFARVLARHDTFRTVFFDVDGVPYQDFRAADRPRVRVADLSGVADPVAAMREEQRRPFPPGGEMVRATLFVESPGVAHAQLVAHHLVADGRSFTVVANQLVEDYDDALKGLTRIRRAPVPFRRSLPPAAAYRDSTAFRDDLAFHRAALDGAAPVLFAKSGTAPGSARHTFRLPGDWVARVRAAGLPIFPYLAAMTGVFLSRVHRSAEGVIGVPLLNRDDEFLDTVGSFTNTVPLRVAVPGGSTVRALVADVEAATRDVRRHGRTPLEDILRELPGRPRQLYDVTLSYVRLPSLRTNLAHRTVMETLCHEQDALAIVVTAVEDEDDVEVSLDCARDVFGAELPAERVAALFGCLLENGIDGADRPVADVPMLPGAERALLEAYGRGAAVPFRAEATLSGLFEEQAARRPDQVAVTGPGFRLTYAELDAAANQVGRKLVAAGVGPGDRVVVALERGPDLLPAVFGVLKAGAAYVPVDPAHPAERIRFLVEDSRPAAVLVSGETALPPLGGTPVWRVGDLREGDASPVGARATATDIAYVIYTSGSSGRPKGVLVRHRSVVNRLAWMQRRYPLGEYDVLLQKTPTSFDVSVWELFWWALEGAAVALLPPGGEKDPRTIRAAVAEHGVTVVHFVPSMLGSFLEAGERDAGSLRRVFCSGEALPAASVERFNHLFRVDGGGPELVNLYGPTEATVDVTYYDCPADAAIARVPIGRPIDNTSLHVVGAHGELQPLGVAGELCIGGVGVAAGYLGRPELTAERFVPDPFGGEGRLYRTGDLARWLPGGDLEYLGRLDDQVKIRGNRVEPGEVAGVLLSAPGVTGAVVVDRTTAARGTHLVGYYVGDGTGLREHLARELPEFMIPAFLVPLECIPLTPNGKADRRALPEPAVGSAGEARPFTAREAVLAGIWGEVLGRTPESPDEDYYALGGDSLLMLRIRALAEKRGLRFALADLVRHPTVAGLAEHVDGAEADEAAPPRLGLVSAVDRVRLGDVEDAYPLTRLQQGLIYHSRETGSTVYKDVFRYRLRLPWDEPEFRKAVARLARRHPALRTSFHPGEYAEPLQIVHHAVPEALEVVDLREVGRVAAEAEVLAHIERRRHHDYDFGSPPLYLFRAHIREDGVDLVLSFHHALLDGGSVATLVSELLRGYAHGLGLRAEPVPDLPLPSAAAYLREERHALASAESADFWHGTLDGSEASSIGGFGPHEPRGARATSHRTDLAPELGTRVREFARERALSVKSVLVAAHCLTLGLFSGNPDVTTGVVTHGRTHDGVAGLFLNTLPLRVSAGGRSWSGVVREAFLAEQAAYAHRRYPLSAIQDRLGRPPAVTAFNYVHFRQLGEAVRIPGVDLLAFDAYEQTSFELLVNVVTDPADDHLWLRVDGNGSTITAAQLRLYGEHYVRVLRELLDRPDDPAGVGFLTAPPPEVVPAAHHADVVARFDRCAADHPAALALTGERQWTYGELAAAAGAVAANLRRRGVRPGSIVGVAAGRDPETIAVLLGVLKAGAAVLPLDTGYPPRRLAHLVEHADPDLVVGSHPALPERRTVAAEELLRPAGEPPSGAVTPETTAYVLFTSGSTGQPKGVAMPHRALANLVAWQHRTASGRAAVTLQYAPLSFDVSFQEIFATLCFGGTLCLVPDRGDPAAVLRLMRAHRVERVFLPYVALQQLASAAVASGSYPEDLRVVISSGEQLRITDEIRRLCAAVPGVLLENQYGPTETHVVTHHALTGPPDRFPDLPPIGTPIDGAALHVLDADLRRVPPGVTGELYAAGTCLAHGYLGRDDLTAERFRDTGSGRLYRTGDLGYALPDGSIVCTGRSDDQAKVRGFRVEPAEAELALGELGRGLGEVAVVVRPRQPGGDNELVAFLTGAPADAGELRAALRETLPEHLVPTHFQWLPDLPRTPSGKRDDAALRALPLEVGGTHDTTPPRDERERVLAELVADLLGLSAIGVHANVFDLGMTSLVAMRVVVTLEQRFGTELAPSALLGAPTVAALARRLGEAKQVFSALVPLRPSGTRRPLFIVHPMGGNVLCYVPLVKHLPDDLPVYALQAAGAEPGSTPLSTVEDLVGRYLAEIRTVQPRGPYTIAGWSFGGFVAFELARRLGAAGEAVDRPILLDTVAVNPLLRESYTDEALLGWFFWELLWIERGGASPLEGLPEHVVSVDDRFEHIARRAAELGVLPAGSSPAVIRRLFRLYRANWEATLAYRPPETGQDIVLVRAEEPLPKVLEAMHGAAGSLHHLPDNGWGGLTGGTVEIVTTPGDHLTIMEEPRVARLARVVSELIHGQEAQSHAS
ncbi:amino acid adenylation domain-containing protein [Amycolatopsis lexingtonensis]|uniref:amino acid adenylation domain-containing protein n=1 Tax=Amycolatopsis lexingtonensis TaxID=218822 RepID=UPI003F6E70C7